MHWLPRLFNRGLKVTPYEFVARGSVSFLPEATLNNIQWAFAYYSATKKEYTCVQIGACDGTSGDSAYGFVKKGFARALLVEPIEQSFRKLQHAYKGVSNVTLVQAAIDTNDGYKIMYKVRDGAASIDPYWRPQLASFDKAHLTKHGVAEHDILEETVPCFTLATLISQNRIDRINVLQVDTEGFDAEVVKMALALPVLPETIYFENKHLCRRDCAELFTLLRVRGYTWSHDGWNTLALHQNLTNRWLAQ